MSKTLELPSPSKTANFFQYTVHLFYGIIIAQSYVIAKDNLIPLNIIFSDSTHQLHSFGIFLAYFMTISSWVGYHRSISKRPHTDTLTGLVRYIFDILIVFSTFYLLHISVTNYFIDQFHIVLIAIFVFYMIWDDLKCREYPEPSTKRKKRQTTRAGKTILFMIFFTLFGIAYTILKLGYWNYIFSLEIVFQITFIILAMVMIAIYRFWKWRVPTTRIAVSSKTNKSKKTGK